MIPERPEEGGDQQIEETRKRARKPKGRSKPEVEPTWGGGDKQEAAGPSKGQYERQRREIGEIVAPEQRRRRGSAQESEASEGSHESKGEV